MNDARTGGSAMPAAGGTANSIDLGAGLVQQISRPEARVMDARSL
jgi:hypothetical protein